MRDTLIAVKLVVSFIYYTPYMHAYLFKFLYYLSILFYFIFSYTQLYSLTISYSVFERYKSFIISRFK